MFLRCYCWCNRERVLVDALVDVLHTVRFFAFFLHFSPIFCQNYSGSKLARPLPLDGGKNKTFLAQASTSRLVNTDYDTVRLCSAAQTAAFNNSSIAPLAVLVLKQVLAIPGFRK